MSIVSIGIKATDGATLNVDAFGNNRESPVQTPVVVDPIALFHGYDNLWKLTVTWGMNFSITTQIQDANDNNALGSNVLQVISKGDGTMGAFVNGRTTGPATAWNILAAGEISGFSALPVQLFQRVNNTPYYIGASNAPPPAGGSNPILVSEGPAGASTWTMAPTTEFLAAPAYGAFQVEGVSVQKMVTEIWNRMFQTSWATKLTPSLICWMYDYPRYFTSPSDWALHVKQRLYDKIYKPYFVDDPPTPGWGTGEPPNVPPPQPPHPHVPPPKPPHPHGPPPKPRP